MKEMPDLPQVDCCCFGPEDFADMGCICGPSERVLRAIKHGKVQLTDDQREWCKSEIDRVEGYSRAEYEMADDFSLASGVLCAWTDYCRDKGMI